MEYREYYSVLGVPRTASEKDIKQAYRKLARQYHPDVNPNDKNAESRFRDINEAYTVLSDPEKRKRYNELGANWDKVQQGAPGGYPGSSESQGYTFHFSPGSGVEGFGDVFEGGGFSDFFRTFFGGAGGEGFEFGGGGRRGSRVPDEYEIEITLDEAYRGATKTFSLPISSECPRCGGRGALKRNLCPECRGQGIVTTPRRVEVRIPKGIQEGQTLRLRPEGHEVLLRVKFRPHPFFKRKPNGDLMCEVTVPALDLILGGQVEIPTLQGKTVVKIPAGTQNGATLRLKGLGMPFNGKHADLLVTVKALLPTALNTKEKNLYEELREIRSK